MIDRLTEERRRKALKLLGNVCPKCGKNEPREPHSCPYACEIRDDHSEDHCTCCEVCEEECSNDT